VRRLLLQPNFVLLLGGTAVSQLGDWALALALPFFVYDRTGSIAATGGLVAAEMVPRLLLSSLGGVLADRWSRRLAMIGSDLFRAALVPALLLVAAGGPIWMVYAVAVLESCAAQLFVPASEAMLPSLVRSREDLFAANSLLSGARAVTQLAGPPLGGLLYLAFGLATSALADSASFVLSALAIVAMRPLRAAPPPEVEALTAPAGGLPGRGVLRELAAGFRFVAEDRSLWLLCVSVGVVMISQGMLNTAIVPFLRGVLHYDAGQFGIVVSAQGVGSLAGAFGAGAIASRLTSGRILGAALIVAGCLLLGFALARSPAVSALSLLLASVPLVVANVWIQTYFQRHVADRFLGRVVGVSENIGAFGVLAGILAASVLGAAVGAASLMLAAAGVLAVTGSLALAALWNASTEPAVPVGAAGVASGGE
jgi:predicted MFS family arabinose efflux permease